VNIGLGHIGSLRVWSVLCCAGRIVTCTHDGVGLGRDEIGGKCFAEGRSVVAVGSKGAECGVIAAGGVHGRGGGDRSHDGDDDGSGAASTAFLHLDRSDLGEGCESGLVDIGGLIVAAVQSLQWSRS
jgi:hypothetical protein